MVSDSDWLQTSDGTISIQVAGELTLVPKSNPFHGQVRRSLQELGDFKQALEYAQFDRAVNRWSQGTPIRFNRRGKLLFDQAPLPDNWRSEIIGRISDGLSAACVTAAVIQAVEIKEAFDTGSSVMQRGLRTESLLSADQCEIAYHGWLTYLNRYGRTVLDSNPETGELLVKSLKNGRVVLIADCPTGKVVVLPVGDKCETCQQAQDWLANNGDARLSPFRNLRVIARI